MPIRPTFLALSAALLLSVQAPRVQAQAEVHLHDAAARSAEVYQRIKQQYVDDVDPTTLQGPVPDVLKTLDKHSGYLDAAQYQALRSNNRGQFGGLGIRLGEENGRFKVVSPMPGTPAQQAGLRDGDWIVALDGRPTDTMKMSELVSQLRGEPGSSIALTLLRDGADAPLSLQLTRALIVNASVEARLLEQRLGYIRISRFHSRTKEELAQALRDLGVEAGGLSGLVLDLRNNPGGLLRISIDVADAFLSEGTIVSTKGRSDGDRSWRAQPDDVLDGAPMVVLVNGRSASAAEIVAGALQENGRAVVMGTRTVGKGSVQSILPLKDGGALKLTTSRYYAPSGRAIDGVGVAPDVVLAADSATAADEVLDAAVRLLLQRPALPAPFEPLSAGVGT